MESHGRSSDSPPMLPPDSPGSSVSSRLQDEYDELLRYAVVIPAYGNTTAKGLMEHGPHQSGRVNDDGEIQTMRDRGSNILTVAAQAVGHHRLIVDVEEAIPGNSGDSTLSADNEVKELPDFGGQSPVPSLIARGSADLTTSSTHHLTGVTSAQNGVWAPVQTMSPHHTFQELPIRKKKKGVGEGGGWRERESSTRLYSCNDCGKLSTRLSDTPQHLRAETRPADQPMTEKLYGSLENLQQTTVFASASGIPVLAIDGEEVAQTEDATAALGNGSVSQDGRPSRTGVVTTQSQFPGREVRVESGQVNSSSSLLSQDGSRSAVMMMMGEVDKDEEEGEKVGSKSTSPLITVTYLDQDLGRVETVLDQWCLDLKRNVLAEIAQAKIRIEQKNRQELLRETSRLCGDKGRLVREVDELKEHLHTLQRTIERKDAIVSNLTGALHALRRRTQLHSNFCTWRLQHSRAKRQEFTWQLAGQHYRRSLNRRVLRAWFGQVHCRWRQRVEKSCQHRAQQVCVQLSADYQAKISSLNEELESAREEMRRMHLQREQYEEAMKKAFMRGVCALNMEAMSMFHGQDGTETEEEEVGTRDSHRDRPSDQLHTQAPRGAGAGGVDEAAGVAGDLPSPSSSPNHHQPVVVKATSASAGLMPGSRLSVSKATPPPPQPSSSKNSACNKKQVWTGVTQVAGCASRGVRQRVWAGGAVPGPPSVVVDRHPAVNKQTLGPATAARLSQQQQQQQQHHKFGRLAGQQAEGRVVSTVRVVD